eukprot:928241-Rhodomonas_salina.2
MLSFYTPPTILLCAPLLSSYVPPTPSLLLSSYPVRTLPAAILLRAPYAISATDAVYAPTSSSIRAMSRGRPSGHVLNPEREKTKP